MTPEQARSITESTPWKRYNGRWHGRYPNCIYCHQIVVFGHAKDCLYIEAQRTLKKKCLEKLIL